MIENAILCPSSVSLRSQMKLLVNTHHKNRRRSSASFVRRKRFLGGLLMSQCARARRLEKWELRGSPPKKGAFTMKSTIIPTVLLIVSNLTTSTSRCSLSGRCLWIIIRNGRSASLKDSIVAIKISNKIKVFLHSCLLQHVPGIAADWVDLSSLKVMVLIQ